MSKKRFVDTSFWSDPFVVDELNPLDRYLFLYFLTNEKTNIAGVYELSLRTISYETGIEKDEVLRMLSRLSGRVVYTEGWVILKNAIKNQNYKNDKIRKGIEISLEKIPQSMLHLINTPKDWIPDVVKRDTGTLQMKFDESSMSLEVARETKYSDSDSDLDIDSDSDSDASSHKSFLKNVDSQLAKKEIAAKHRKPGKGYKQATAIASEIKRRNIGK